MKRRALDANEIILGAEPKFDSQLSKVQLMNALSWYSQNKLTKDSLKYANAYFKKYHKISSIDEFLKNKSSSYGFVCRIIQNGGKLPEQESQTFEKFVSEIIQETKIKTKKKVVANPIVKVISIQDRLTEKVAEIIGDLEGSIDEYIETKYKREPSPTAIMQDRTKSIHAKRIAAYFKNKRIEYDNVVNTKDSQLKEGYSNFKKTELKKIIAYLDNIITEAIAIDGEVLKTRKPRKRKTKTPDQLVAKMLYKEKDEDYKIESIKPKDVIGAMQLWVFNTKTRKLGCYHALDGSGFSCKGTTLLNFNELKSKQKTIRKPFDVLPGVLQAGKVALRSILEQHNTAEIDLTGRINSDTILLRVVK